MSLVEWMATLEGLNASPGGSAQAVLPKVEDFAHLADRMEPSPSIRK